VLYATMHKEDTCRTNESATRKQSNAKIEVSNVSLSTCYFKLKHTMPTALLTRPQYMNSLISNTFASNALRAPTLLSRFSPINRSS
jgi:hypothetical protein